MSRTARRPKAAALPDAELLARAIHAVNLTYGDCDHAGGIGDCQERCAEYLDHYARLAKARERQA